MRSIYLVHHETIDSSTHLLYSGFVALLVSVSHSITVFICGYRTMVLEMSLNAAQMTSDSRVERVVGPFEELYLLSARLEERHRLGSRTRTIRIPAGRPVSRPFGLVIVQNLEGLGHRRRVVIVA